MNLYLDASATVKLFLEEAESGAVKARLRAATSLGGKLFVSSLTVLETKRALLRNKMSVEDAVRFFRSTDMVAITPQILEQTTTVRPATLKTLDAIHLATAMVLQQAVGVEFVAFDRRLIEAAQAAGITVASPGL
jgi:predicted nucleic acid-binding protein